MLKSYFRREVFPVLTPLAIDPTHPFPLILNKSLNLIVSLKNPNPKLRASIENPQDHGHDDHGHDHDHDHGDGGEKHSSVADDYPLDVCVVGGEKLGSMGKPVVIQHEGVTVKFCCKGCIEDFEEDPKKFIAKLEAAKNGGVPKPAQEKPETEPENKENKNSEVEKPAEQGDGEKE